MKRNVPIRKEGWLATEMMKKETQRETNVASADVNSAQGRSYFIRVIDASKCLADTL